MNQGNSGLTLILIYIFLAIYLLPIFPNEGSANDFTRWATAVSLVEKNSFEISWTKDFVKDFVDVTEVEKDKIYSNKPPGIALLSAPFYAITRVFLGTPTPENTRTSWFILRFLLASLPLVMLAYWLLSQDVDTFSLATLLFATPLFAYSLLYYSHVLVAVLVYFAFRLTYDTFRVFPERCFNAGFLMGIAFLCEYSVAIPLIIFGLGLTFTEKIDRSRRLVFYIAGFAPALFILVLYNHLIFGSPLAMFTAYGISYPMPENLYRLLVSTSRGLFVFSPILIFSVITFFSSQESDSFRHRIKVFTIIATLIAICGFSAKHDGWSMGARHLIIIVPLLLDSFFDGEVELFSSYWRGFLFTVSFLFCAVPMLTYPFAPPELQFPHNSFWQPLLVDNQVFTLTSINTFGVEINFWTILPIIISFLIILLIVWREARFPYKFAVGILAGLLLVGNYMFIPKLENEKATPLREKVIAEYSYKKGS